MYKRQGVTFEQFNYQKDYKSLLALAAVEQRIRVDLELEKQNYTVNLFVNVVGERDLEEYGYGDRYNVHDGATASSRKGTKAEAFYTLDLKGSYNLTKDYKLYAGVKNLLDYTQEESPLFFNQAGDFDVTHIYGPMRGRQVYLGIQSKF